MPASFFCRVSHNVGHIKLSVPLRILTSRHIKCAQMLLTSHSSHVMCVYQQQQPRQTAIQILQNFTAILMKFESPLSRWYLCISRKGEQKSSCFYEAAIKTYMEISCRGQHVYFTSYQALLSSPQPCHRNPPQCSWEIHAHAHALLRP